MINYTHMGNTDAGEVVFYRISDGGAEAVVSDLGATLVALFLNVDGRMRDVTLGFDTPQEYLKDGSYIGAVVGRNCNRIANASFELGGKTFKIEANEGANSLHSGNNPYKNRKFDARIEGENSVTFILTSPDGDQGFPGNLEFKVTYTMTGDVLRIDYEGTSDKDTVFNPTGHAYFNLSGHESGSRAAMSQTLKLACREFTPQSAELIPFGEKRNTENSPFDFSDFHRLSERIDETGDEQIKNAGGYDTNFLIDGPEGEFKYAATLKAEDGSVEMDVFTDRPALQVYTANMLSPVRGKGGVMYERRCAVCLETQYTPNAINMAGFAKPVIKAGETAKSRTEYRFRVRRTI